MFFGRLFKQKKIIFSKKDKAAWTAAKAVLSEAGIRNCRAYRSEEEAPGCG